MVEVKNSKLKEISLEEKLKKLISTESKKIKKQSDKPDKKLSEKKESKDKKLEVELDEKNAVSFEQRDTSKDNFFVAPLIEDANKKENLEESVLEVSTNETKDNPLMSTDTVNYNSEHTARNYSGINMVEDIGPEKYNSGVKNVGRILGSGINERSPTDLTNNRRSATLNPFSRDITNYSESHLNNTQKYNEQDSMRKYEETERQFYETSRRDIREKALDKNV